MIASIRKGDKVALDNLSVSSAIRVENQTNTSHPAAQRNFESEIEIPSEKQLRKMTGFDKSPAGDCSVQEIWVLTQEFMEDFNRAIPLFDEVWVKKTFCDLRNGDKSIEPSSMLCFQVILAIAHRLRAQSPVSTHIDELQASKYLQYISSQLGDFLLQKPSLLQAQCLMGMAILLQGTGLPERACALIAAALRILDQLHTNAPATRGLKISQNERQTLNVWWIGLFVDTSICLRKNLEPTIGLDEAQMSLLHLNVLTEAEAHWCGIIQAVDGGNHFSIFQAHVELAVLQMKVLRFTSTELRLHGSTQDDDELLALSQQFTNWRKCFSYPLTPTDICIAFHRSDIVHILILEAKAYETICAIYGIRNNDLVRLKRFQFWKTESNSVETLVIEASKTCLELFTLAPSGDVACNL
jgi:hypothetical protein